MIMNWNKHIQMIVMGRGDSAVSNTLGTGSYPEYIALLSSAAICYV
jgi:hypothetical protein